ncbi:MAG: YqgE/AlgH family protein [Burkholderiales bacterium]
MFALPAAHAQNIANGVFLVAQPSLTEPTFRRTVILITQLPQAGPIGVIINRPMEVPLSDIFPKHENLAAQPQKLHFGGPVARQELMFLVRADKPPPRSIAVLQDVYLMGDADWVEGALAASDSNVLSAVRVFAGHSGWAPGQLQNELKREGWYMLPADSETIFEKDIATIWPELVKRAALRATLF